MTRDQWYVTLGLRLGNRADAATLCQAEVIETQTIHLERNVWLPWFLLRHQEAITPAIGSSLLPLPANFLREYEEDDCLWLGVDGEKIPLRKGSVSELQDRYPGTGTPKAYAVVGADIYLFPAPETADTIYLTYFASDDTLATNIENKWLRYAPDWFAAQLCLQIAEKHLRDHEIAEKFRADLATAQRRVYIETVAKEEASRARKMES